MTNRPTLNLEALVELEVARERVADAFLQHGVLTDQLGAIDAGGGQIEIHDDPRFQTLVAPSIAADGRTASEDNARRMA